MHEMFSNVLNFSLSLLLFSICHPQPNPKWIVYALPNVFVHHCIHCPTSAIHNAIQIGLFMPFLTFLFIIVFIVQHSPPPLEGMSNHQLCCVPNYFREQ